MSGVGKPVIAVIGAGNADAELYELARATGRLLGESRAVVVTGGLGGVMEAASRGTLEGGGETVGILPGDDPRDANPWVQIPIATGLGDARNAIVATAGRGVIAIGGEVGTLSEIALALKRGLPVVALRSWGLDHGRLHAARRYRPVDSPEEAVRTVIAEIDAQKERTTRP